MSNFKFAISKAQLTMIYWTVIDSHPDGRISNNNNYHEQKQSELDVFP